MVVSASPADPPAVSFAGTDAPLLPVPLTSGPRLLVRAREGARAGHGHGLRALVGRVTQVKLRAG
jgi:hypothetical protein